MAGQSGARAGKALSGDLGSRPLAVLLAGACERQITGTFAFLRGEQRAMLTIRHGKIAVVRTSEPSPHLGGVLYELGAIDAPTLNRTLGLVARSRRMHGEVLLERGLVTRAQLDEALAEQTCRMVHQLFALPDDTTWSFSHRRDELAGARDEDRPVVEPWPALWRGLRAHPPAAHVRRTLAKMTSGIHLTDLRAVERFGLAPEERAVCERLAEQAMTIAQLVSTSPLVTERTELIVYLLAVTRMLVSADACASGPVALGTVGIRTRARRIVDEDPWTVLGLPRGASIEASRAAYLRLARQWHPARIPAALREVAAECEIVFSRITDAHQALTDRSATTAPGRSTTMLDVDAALEEEDLVRAEALARALSSAGDTGPSARAVVAWCAAEAGHAPPEVLERAVAMLDKILTGDPNCARALLYRGELQKRLGRVEQAERDFRRVTRRPPPNADARSGLRRLGARASGK